MKTTTAPCLGSGNWRIKRLFYGHRENELEHRSDFQPMAKGGESLAGGEKELLEGRNDLGQAKEQGLLSDPGGGEIL